MTSKSTVSWGQQGGPGGRAGRESPTGVCGGGPSREPRPPPAVHLPWPRRASLVTENSPQSRLSRVLTAFPHSLLSTLGQVTGLLWACRGQSQAELEGASAPSPSSRAHEAGGDDSCRDTQGLLPPVLSRGTLGFLTGTPAPTYPFISFLLTLSQKIDTPFHLICILFPLHALPLGSSLPPARFSSLCPCPAPREAQLFPCPRYASSFHPVPLSCLLIDSAPLVTGIISLPIFNCVTF